MAHTKHFGSSQQLQCHASEELYDSKTRHGCRKGGTSITLQTLSMSWALLIQAASLKLCEVTHIFMFNHSYLLGR